MPQPWEKTIVKVFSISDMQYFAYSTMANSPDTLVLIICLMALFIGPCLFISLYTIAYIIDCITLNLSPNHQPPFELGM